MPEDQHDQAPGLACLMLAIPMQPSMRPTVVINAAGLTPDLIGPSTPRLRAFRDAGAMATIEPVLPAVTCSVQATYLTGHWPDQHGIVGNGWYFKEEGEIRFWRQSARLVKRPRIWDMGKSRDPAFTCAVLFWWHAMYASADIVVTPRPMYPADGRKIPDLWTDPPELRDTLQRELGRFPLFRFWGPGANIQSTQWIVESTLRLQRRHRPTLTLVYLPHLDYDLQRFGPESPHTQQAAAELDEQVGRLIDHFDTQGYRIIILSEYGIAPVDRPIHLNRVLREQGLLRIREELGRELLDVGASPAVAVADHQVAHVYIHDENQRQRIRQVIQATTGVASVLEGSDRSHIHLNHERAGDLVVLAEPGAWFTYYYWLDERRRPDFAPTVDIHRKPGYDPAELMFDPKLRHPTLRAWWRVLQQRLGWRSLVDVIGTDASIIRGSHGIEPSAPCKSPCLITNSPGLLKQSTLEPTHVSGLILDHVFEPP